MSWAFKSTIAVLAASLPVCLAEADVIVKPPAGFELEAEGVETILDILYQGKRVAETTADIRDGQITFTDPNGLASLIPVVRDHETIAKRLSTPLDTHQDRLCREADNVDCGWIEADIAEIIYNPGQLSVEIFINERFIYGRDERARYLPPPTSSAGLINQVNVRGYQNLKTNRFSGSAYIDSIAGLGRWSVRSENVLTDQNQTLQSLSLNHIGQKRAWAAGILRPDYQSGLIQSYRLAGARWGSTLDTRLDRAELSRSTLPISVTEPALVEIIRDGVVLDEQQIEPGTNWLDTSRLPSGTYDVTLRINSGGSIREVVETFSSGRGLPPAGQTIWSLNIGTTIPRGIQNTNWFPELGDSLLLDVRAERRLQPGIALGGRLLYVGDMAVAEAGLAFEKNRINGSIDALLGSDSTYGIDGRIGWQQDRFRLSMNYREISRSNDTRDNPVEYEPIPRAYRQAGLNVGWSWNHGRIGLRTYYRRDQNSENWFVTPSLDYTVLKQDNFQLYASFRQEFGANNDSSFFGLRLNVNPHRKIKNWQHTINAHSSYRTVSGPGKTTDDTFAEVNWRANKQSPGSSRSEISASVRYDDVVGGKLRMRHENEYGAGDFEFWQNYQRQDAIRFNGYTTLATNFNYIGLSAKRGSAGVFLAADGAKDIDVVANLRGQKSGPMGGQSSRFMPLSGFNIYDVGLKPASPADVEYGAHLDRIILYPGNVPTVRRAFERVQIVISRLVDGNGEPISNVEISDEDNKWIADADSSGYFQADIASNLTTLIIQRDQMKCHLPKRTEAQKHIKNEFVNLDEIICLPSD